jgi:hypothetical protein
LNLLQLAARTRGLSFRLVERNIDVRHQTVRRPQIGRTHVESLEREAPVEMVAEALLHASLLVRREIQFCSGSLTAAEHTDVGTAKARRRRLS